MVRHETWSYSTWFGKCSIHYACNQARNQLGTSGGAKSFLRGAQIFWTMSNSFKQYPTHFSRGAKNFLGGIRPSPSAPPGYGPAYNVSSL